MLRANGFIKRLACRSLRGAETLRETTDLRDVMSPTGTRGALTCRGRPDSSRVNGGNLDLVDRDDRGGWCLVWVSLRNGLRRLGLCAGCFIRSHRVNERSR